MKKLLSLLLCALMLLSLANAESVVQPESAAERASASNLIASVKTTLKKKMATRSGPGTRFTSTGTYPKSTEVTAIEKYDVNGTYWVLVEFKHKDARYRAYTGLKRLKASSSEIPNAKYTSKKAKIDTETTISYGPGTNYAAYKKKLAVGTEIKVVGAESGYAHVDVKYRGKIRRGYIPEGTFSYIP